jgi:hypothetical protein
MERVLYMLLLAEAWSCRQQSCTSNHAHIVLYYRIWCAAGCIARTQPSHRLASFLLLQPVRNTLPSIIHPSRPSMLQCIITGGAVLDIMSSWVSHLPPEVTYGKVVGHGMNAAELAKNPRLDSHWVRDLNKDPDTWAAADNSYDAVVCCVR